MTKPTSGAPRRPKRQKQQCFTKKSGISENWWTVKAGGVLKMLTVMSENGNGGNDPVQDFLTTGRAGRRNALPNILSDHALTSTADLPDSFMGLSTGDKKDGDEEASTSADIPKEDIGDEACGSSS